MVVTRLRLRDFRSYATVELALGERLTVVHGRNGAGKTNLLEAADGSGFLYLIMPIRLNV